MARAAASPGSPARDALLALLSPSGQPAPELGPAAWEQLDAMAVQHRLQPLLHHLTRECASIPAEMRLRWKGAYRAAAASALIVRAELDHTCGLLEAAGFRPIALKGAWLAWHAYPHPALRPMRDLDLLLDETSVIAAYEVLLCEGYRATDTGELALADVIRLDKHLPALISPRGISIELHQRLWEIAGRTDHAAPAVADAAIRARTIRQGGIAFLAPQDLLGHLIVHAVYDHRLDCGPLVLSDIAFLVEQEEIDWPSFWAGARDGGWDRGARLMLAMVRRAHPRAAGRLAFPADEGSADALAEQSARLLLQDLSTRQSAGVFATLAAGGGGAFLRRIAGRRKAAKDGHATVRDMSSEGGFRRWAGARLWRTLRDMARAEVRGQSRDLARLSRWLDT